MKKLFPIFIFVSIFGCGKRIETISPAKTAYTDGFEVVVIKNGEVDKADSFKLSEAEALIASDSKHILAIPVEKIESIQKAIEKANKSNPKSSYPFVNIQITKEKGFETVILSFHYSKSTFTYCYKVEKQKIVPLWSSFRDLKKNKKTIYKESPNKTDFPDSASASPEI